MAQIPEKPDVEDAGKSSVMSIPVEENRKWEKWVPIVGFLSNYDWRKRLQRDLVAGLTVGVMLIPQFSKSIYYWCAMGMAYASVAGLPPQYGLYSSFLPVIIYAIFGSSRELAVGPVAIVSLLVHEFLADWEATHPTSSSHIQLALFAACFSGVFLFVLGLARAGFAVAFLSHPVIEGFTAAAAIHIGGGQLKHLLGIQLPRRSYFVMTLYDIASLLPKTNGVTLLLGLLCIAILLGVKKIQKKYQLHLPGPLFVVVVGTSIAALLQGKGNVNTIGNVPSGLFVPSAPMIPDFLPVVSHLATPVAVLSLVGFMESVSIGKSIATKAGYEIRPNQELIALGLANIIGSFFGAYPVTGGFSRTAVNAQAGATSPLAGMVAALVVMCALLFLTPLFYYLPHSALASIILVAVSKLIKITSLRHAWKIKKEDFWLQVITTISTLLIGVELGIAVGVIISLLAVIKHSARPSMVVLGRVHHDGGIAPEYRNVERFPEARVIHGVLAVRIDAELFFGNAQYVHDTIYHFEKEKEEQDQQPMKQLIVDLSGVSGIDSTALEMLKTLVEDHMEKKIAVCLAGAKAPVRDVFSASGFDQRNDVVFDWTLHDAIERISQREEEEEE